MANFLIVDADNIALNAIALEVPKGGKLIEYDGPFYPGGVFDGKTVAEPPPPPDDITAEG